MSPPPETKPTSRELEIAQLELALEKTARAQAAAMATLDALARKQARQLAELRFQKLLLRWSVPEARSEAASNEQSNIT